MPDSPRSIQAEIGARPTSAFERWWNDVSNGAFGARWNRPNSTEKYWAERAFMAGIASRQGEVDRLRGALGYAANPTQQASVHSILREIRSIAESALEPKASAGETRDWRPYEPPTPLRALARP